jgi:hypothetical protein
MRIGSDEHKELFCRSFIDSHRPFEPAELAWPQLDELSLARLRAIPVWSMAISVESNAGPMLYGFAKTEPDPLVRQALELQGYEEARHGRILACMFERYGINARPAPPDVSPTRRSFVNFGYDECLDSFAGFGIFRLACDARIMPESLTALFAPVIEEEARHIVFFINWIAWDRARRGLSYPFLQLIPSLSSYALTIARHVRMGSAMADGAQDGRPASRSESEGQLNLFADILDDLTPAKFLRACIEENERYMRQFDPRLLRPTFVPTTGKAALALLTAYDRLRAPFRKPASA